MTKILLIIFYSALTITACSSAKNHRSSNQIQQGIDGYVYKISGNLMPMPGVTPPKPNPLSTVVYVYEATNIKDVNRNGTSAFYLSVNKKLIGTVQSDSTGHFIIELPTGDYSLFTKVNNLFYANNFDVNNNIALIKVEEGKITSTVIKVDAGAVY